MISTINAMILNVEPALLTFAVDLIGAATIAPWRIIKTMPDA